MVPYHELLAQNRLSPLFSSELSHSSPVPLPFLFESRGEGPWEQAKVVAKQYNNS